MKARKHFVLIPAIVFAACCFSFPAAWALGPTVQPPQEAPAIYVISQGMENQVMELLPDGMTLAGGYVIGNILIEESSICVDFSAADGKTVKIRLGHPEQLEGAYGKTAQFAVKAESGDTAKLKTMLDDLLARLRENGKNWSWAKASRKVQNIPDRSAAYFLSPECAGVLKKTEAGFQTVSDSAGMLKIMEENATGKEDCDSWLLMSLMKSADMTVSEQLERLARSIKSVYYSNSAMIMLGIYYQRNSQNARARDVWNELIEKQPALVEAALRLANVMAIVGYGETDLARFQQRLDKNPNDKSADLVLGVLKYYMRDYSGALPHLQRSVKYNNVGPEILVFLVMTDYFLGRKDEAMRLTDENIGKPGQSRRLYYCKAFQLLEKDRNAAMDYLVKFIESHGAKVSEAATNPSLEVKEAWELLEYVRNWREDSGVDLLAPLDMQAPWPMINNYDYGVPANPQPQR